MALLLLLLATFTGNQGSAVQLTLPNEPGAKSVEVMWQNKKIPAFHIHDGWTTIVGVDLDTKAGDHQADVVLTMDDGRIEHRDVMIKVVSTKYPTTELKVEEKYVELSKTDLARANRESKETEGIYAITTNEMLFDQAFTIPIPGG